jgi:predicted DCC family thiol-disulfide oxidoreductase YuxK
MGSTLEVNTYDHPIIFFDGVCNLCNSSVNFIIDRDPRAIFRFASLQSVAARELLKDSDFNPEELDSILLFKEGRVYSKSDAALEISSDLPFPWSLLRFFKILPKIIRDSIYTWIANNRYNWFGKSESCRLPTPELKDRFLDS